MKLQQFWKKFFCKLVFMAAALSLAACSGREEKIDSSGRGQKEAAYQAEGKEVDLDGVKKEDIGSSLINNGRLYIYYSQTVKGREKKYLLSCNLDGSDIKKTGLAGFRNKEDILAMAVDDQGKKRFITRRGQKFFLYAVHDDGSILDSVELRGEKGEHEEEWGFCLYPGDQQKIVFLNGRLYAASYNQIYVFDEKGREERVYQCPGYLYEFCRTSDGKFYVYRNDDEAGKEQNGFCEFDPKTGKCGKFFALEEYSFQNDSIVRGKGSGIYLNDDKNIYAYDCSTGKMKEELNWFNCGRDGDSICCCFLLEQGKFFAIACTDQEGGKGCRIEFITVDKGKAENGKETLTLAVNSMDPVLKEEILSFNRTNEDICIEIRDYSDYEDPKQKMSLDFAAGHIPDMISVNYDFAYDTLAGKGIFTDLYPFMEKDPEIKKEDFFPSVLETMEKEGKLYSLPSEFMVQFLAVPKKIAGDREGWTVDEMLKAYEGMKKGASFMGYDTKENFISTILLYSIGDYVNYDAGEASFTSENFIKLLEYSKNFVSQKDYDFDHDESTEDLVRKEKLFISREALDRMSDIQRYLKLYQGKGGLAVMSYPSKDKSGRLPMTANGVQIAITGQCGDKDAAWQFVRRFLTYDFQKRSDENGYYFPSRKDAFERNLEHAMATEKYTDEDGVEVEPYQSSWDWGYHIEIGPLSKKEADMLRKIVSRIGIYASYEIEEIENIIFEECGAFYAGDKTAEETAEIIQSRVEIYISENS